MAGTLTPANGNLTTTNATPATGIATWTKTTPDTLVQFWISGTYGTVTFIFEASLDGGTTWMPIAAKLNTDNSLLTGTISPADNSKNAYSLDAAGFDSVRLSVTAIASGTLAVGAKSASYVMSPSVPATSTANLGAVTSTSNASSGKISSSSPTAGIGYATGAGGAVTQATNRTTGVTLNNVCGAITLISAAGSATPASFTVTNSAVAALDTVIVSQKSGTDLYEIFVTTVAAGSFKITSFTTGGTTTEQPVFNFAVIKAVAS